MKRWLVLIGVFVVAFVGLIYYSTSVKPEEKLRSQVIDRENIETLDFQMIDSVEVIASNLYEADFLKNIMQGKHYREAWSTKIKTPVLFLDTLFGGVQVVDEGGGKQTKSLKLTDEKGVFYTLRSINKNPTPLVPEIAETLQLENIVVDGISAQHPYAALPVSYLAQSVGLLHTKPKLVFLPKQDLLKSYNNDYGNKLYLLEYETEGEVNWTNYSNVEELLDTDDLIEWKEEHGANLSIDHSMLIKNRLFDLLIGDWDRHAKQWGWIVQRADDSYLAIPLGGDRDNAFFDMEGIIPSIISHPSIIKHLRSFEMDIPHLPELVQPFDRYFLLHSEKDDFLAQALELQKELTDEVIDEAFKLWPEKFQQLNGDEIKEKIRSRREKLPVYAAQFFDVIQEQGTVDQPLKGCEDLKIPDNLTKCFECL